MPRKAANIKQAEIFNNCLGFERSLWQWKTAHNQLFQKRAILVQNPAFCLDVAKIKKNAAKSIQIHLNISTFLAEVELFSAKWPQRT